MIAGVWLILMVLALSALSAACIVAADEDCGVTDLRQELAEEGDVREARADFGGQAGFTEEDMRLIFGTKFHLHRLQERLRGDLEALAVLLLDEAEPTEAKAAAVQDYLDRREQTLQAMSDIEQRLIRQVGAQDDPIEQRLIRQVGAQDDPVKMGALLIFRVMDSGRRVLCAVYSEISGGGGGGIKHNEIGHGLQQPLGN